MSQVIIYLQDNGVPAVVMPTPECLQSHSIEWIANKDVPGSGTPYWIVDAKDLPDAPQEAWVIDPNTPPTGVTP
jgi:hypothetical protein